MCLQAEAGLQNRTGIQGTIRNTEIRRTWVVSFDENLNGAAVVDEFVGLHSVIVDTQRSLSQRLTKLRLRSANHYRRLPRSAGCWSDLGPVLWTCTQACTVHDTQWQWWVGLGWARFNVPLDTFRSFQRRWGGCGISQNCSRSQHVGLSLARVVRARYC